MTQLLQGYLGVGDQLQVDIDDLLACALIAGDDPLVMTEDGNVLLKQAVDVQRDSMARIHVGVSDEQFLTTMKVLRHMIHNTDGTFWHH